MSADNIVGLNSDNEDFDLALHSAPGAGIGTMHDLYVTNSSQYNTLQALNSAHSRLDIPFLQFGECLHGVGSFRQSIFPQSIGLAASWDTDLVRRVGRAIGSEARSIGVHACFSPVLDLGADVRWGRGEYCLSAVDSLTE
jgi:beta-glucosidase-like glycosyl hydrolase